MLWYIPLLCILLFSRALDALAVGGKGLVSAERRALFSRVLALITVPQLPAGAAVTDETDTFFDNWWSSAASPDPATADTNGSQQQGEERRIQGQVPASDEVLVRLSKSDLLSSEGGLGIELGEVEFRTNLRVFVKSVNPGSLADRLGIQKNWVFVSLNGQSAERTNGQGIALMLGGIMKDRTTDTIELKFRDPSIFRQRLSSLSEGESVTTQVAPSGDTTQRNQDGSVKTGRSVTSQLDQKITVSQIVPPKMCQRGATTDDLLEISYVGRLAETGQIFDGSAVKINGDGIPGRGNDVTLYFVLGKQPFGQFPPGWDTGLYGMCVGERRRVTIPPVLAYGSVGLPRRGIPPGATLQYDITLVSMNGLSTPQ